MGSIKKETVVNKRNLTGAIKSIHAIPIQLPFPIHLARSNGKGVNKKERNGDAKNKGQAREGKQSGGASSSSNNGRMPFNSLLDHLGIDNIREHSGLLLTPAVLYYPPEVCIQQAKNGRLGSVGERSMYCRSTSLFIYWISRLDPATLINCTAYSSRNHGVENPFQSILNSSDSSYMNLSHSLSKREASRYSFGMRVYRILMKMKTDSMKLEEKGPNSSPEQLLASFWDALSVERRIQLVKEELGTMSKPARSVWCQCNGCCHRRIGMRELHEQLLKAYCEELERFIASNGRPQEATMDSTSRRWLYKTITLVSMEMINARNRSVFDVMSAFSGLRFTNLPAKNASGGDKEDLADGSSEEDEGFIEYPSDSESDCECSNDDLEESNNELRLEGLISDGSLDDRNEHDEYTGFSDDDELIAACEGELAIDESELVGPIAAVSYDLAKHWTFRRILQYASTDGNRRTNELILQETLIEQGRTVFQLFTSELLHHRILVAYWEEETRRQQQLLLQEEEERERKEREKVMSKRQRKRKNKSKAVPVSADSQDDMAEDHPDTVNGDIGVPCGDHLETQSPPNQTIDDCVNGEHGTHTVQQTGELNGCRNTNSDACMDDAVMAEDNNTGSEPGGYEGEEADHDGEEYAENEAEADEELLIGIGIEGITMAAAESIHTSPPPGFDSPGDQELTGSHQYIGDKPPGFTFDEDMNYDHIIDSDDDASADDDNHGDDGDDDDDDYCFPSNRSQDPFHYLTSSLFGPSLFQSVLL